MSEQAPLAASRRAVVVGGGSGIGAAIAAALAADGCVVTVADRDLARAETVAAALAGEGHVAAPVEVTDEESVEALFGAAAEYGPLDVVVNCAGITTLGLLTELKAESFRRVVDVNLTGSFLVIKHAGPRIAAGGSITSITSLNARQPGRGMGAYCSAKAGLSMLTEVAALELASAGVRVNAIAPGLVETPLTGPALQVGSLREEYLENVPLGRAGTPEDIAQAAVYVTRAGWLTGEVLDLNGGAHLMRSPDLHGHLAGSAVAPLRVS